MTDFNSISSTVLATFGDLSWGILIKSTVALSLAALACRMLHRHAAALRHLVWVGGLAASLVILLASLLLPQFTLSILPSNISGHGFSVLRDFGQESPQIIQAPTGAENEFDVDGTSEQWQRESQTTTEISADSLKSSQDSGGFRSLFLDRFDAKQVLTTCWLIGTIFSAMLFLISVTWQRVKLNRLTKIHDVDWQKSVASAAQAIGITRPIVTLQAGVACVPAVAGVFRPCLVIPSDWMSWTATQRRCILLHELAHIKRYDVAAQLFGRLALLVYWFNPLMWYAVKRLRIERELAADDSVLLAGQIASDYAEQLLVTLRCYRPVRTVTGVAMAHSARLDQRVLAILDPQRRRNPVSSRLAVILICIVGVVCGVLGGTRLSSQEAVPAPLTDVDAAQSKEALQQMWKENYTIEYPRSLPVSVVFSADGKMLLTGDTSGDVMALVFKGDDPSYSWKTKVEGSHAAVAFSVDQQQAYVTTEHGVRILETVRGKEVARIEEQGSNPISLGVFPDKTMTEEITRSQIVFGNSRGYFIKSWIPGRIPETTGTIKTGTVKQGAAPVDESAVPLAVDPQGRSAIMTGPIDGTGKLTGKKGRNVLWAYVCGDYEEGSPGNRVMVGHTAIVVSAAWAKEGSTAVTGDVDGRVIVWDAKTMKETRRLELGGRVSAVAISDDGSKTAACVARKNGCDFYIWETAIPTENMTPIHTELGDFNSEDTYASLSFSSDAQRLAGCAICKQWLTRQGKFVGKVHVWELANEPQAQLPPKHLYEKTLPKGATSNFVILDNHSIMLPADKEGAIFLRSINDGAILARLTLGEFNVRKIKASSDRKWLAIEQHSISDAHSTAPLRQDFEVGVYDSLLSHKATIPECRQVLDIASGGKAIAVVRENGIEVWDIATTKLLKSAPFKHTRIDAAAFSPDGKLLATSDRNDLVLWRWEEGQHDRIRLGRTVGSLTFSPNGRYLAEGPTLRENIQIRNIETRKIVQTLANGTKQRMNVPSMAFTQGGRVLIACDNITDVEGIEVPYRINLWDTATGEIAHQIALPTGLPHKLEVSPNERHLVVTLDGGDSGMKLSVWRLDGIIPMRDPNSRAAAEAHQD